MYKKSSKGNPFHDELGRFTTADGRGVKGIRGGNSTPVMWSSFGEQHDVKNLSVDKRKELDIEVSDTAMNDGRRHYHNQSIRREKNAKKIASVTFPKGLTRQERKDAFHKATVDFRRENRHAINRGGKVHTFIKGNTVSYQIVQAERMASETHRNKSSVVRNTSTSMKQFSGFGVEFTSNNSLVRSCKKGATLKEAQEHFSKYCQKYKAELSKVEVNMKIWKSNDRVMYMPTYRFENEQDAREFAKNFKGARVVNYDDGSKA